MLNNYLNLITSQHRDKPRYIGTLTALLQPYQDIFDMAVFFDEDFDLEYAIGRQLDICGEILDKDRLLKVEITDTYFTWDTEGLGWGQGIWKNLYDPDSGITSLPDDVYRRILKVKVLSNQWNGTMSDAKLMYDIIFADTGAKVVIADNQDMTMTVGFVGLPSSPVYMALLRLGEMFIKPAGVRIDFYLYSSEPTEKLFAWDSDSDRLGGWDEGYWGIEVKMNEGGN